ncbi:Wzz/FepE/Etk N-terminal domain-containing protein [Flavobacterium sp. ACN6]|uniref:Wzz/FepE/Etk N-terminal domain-containing protein n=1 Tax=Flavobacterium sp. ACN6 TaxID=1920426 RepID=UPI000BB2E6CE|nr:Wzz/FepE/Etk N-terminal domain-containing protein [Flavobacterium sp. ACN6]PBJ13882.1 Chain length determinant protein [Flavobacterium sp. ACN6]
MNNKTLVNEEISLKDLILQLKDWFLYLLSKWKIIIAAALFGTLLGITYSLIKKPIYTASLSFALEDEKGGGIGGALGLANTLGLDLGGSGGGIFEGSNLTELIKSRSMVEKTLLSAVKYDGKIISLAEMYIQINEWRADWAEIPKLANVQFLPNSDRKVFTRVQDSILGVMYKNLSKSDLSVAQKDKKISITSIDISSTNEIFAKYFCDALAQEVSDFYIATKSKKARMNMAILERQTDSIRRELNGAIMGVAVANDNTFNLNPALNVRRTPSAKRQVDVQANTAILTELVKQTELAKVTLRKETPLIQIIDRPILPLNKVAFGKFKGVLIGGFLGAFFSIVVLLCKRLLKNVIDIS